MKPEHFTAMVLHSDMKPSGDFTSSDPLVNQLQKIFNGDRKEISLMYLQIVRSATSGWGGQEMHKCFPEQLHSISMCTIFSTSG